MTSEASTLSELIGDIYDAALDPTLWIRTLERFCSFVRGSSALLYWHDVAAERSAALHLFNDDPHYTPLYFEPPRSSSSAVLRCRIEVINTLAGGL